MNKSQQSLFMNSLTFVVFLHITVCTSNSSMNPLLGLFESASCGDWCYDEEAKFSSTSDCAIPTMWTDVHCLTGDRQSPIDIPDILNTTGSSNISLSTKYSSFAAFDIVNTGHSVSITPNNVKEFVMKGSELNGSYILAAIHFHWGNNNTHGSEHLLSGQSFSMEGHLVHHKTQYKDLNEALGSDDNSAVAVIGIFFHVDGDGQEKDSDAFTGIVGSLPGVQSAELKSTGSRLRISALIPSASEVFNYQGSLTTPCCDQKVFWTVFQTPLSISNKQMDEFRNLKYHNGQKLLNNFREPQPLNERVIRKTSCTVDAMEQGYNSAAVLAIRGFSLLMFNIVLYLFFHLT